MTHFLLALPIKFLPVLQSGGPGEEAMEGEDELCAQTTATAHLFNMLL